MQKLISFLALAAAYFRLNLKSQLEYRAAFLSQAVAMFVNDCIWVAFWSLFFTRFQVVNGWHAGDVITLWAISAGGFGLAHAFFGNALSLATIIARGELDVWLLYPRALLPHLLLGRMNASAFGDAVFGFAVYLLFVGPDLVHFALFTLLTVIVAFLFVGFSVITGSLGFYLGNAEVISEQWRFAMITFSTYPFGLFEGQVKWLLFTLIPAAFVSHFPMEALRQLSILNALYALCGALGVMLVAVVVFYQGLRRYESGNLLLMRG